MKKIFSIIGLSLFLASCASAQIQAQTTKNSQTSDEYTISADIFDTLQRPLSFQLSSQCKPISRLCWEYHMAGIGWWDIYLMTGKKLGVQGGLIIYRTRFNIMKVENGFILSLHLIPQIPHIRRQIKCLVSMIRS